MHLDTDLDVPHEPQIWPSDEELQATVSEHLERAQGVDTATIGVVVERGVVHLDGEVASADQGARAVIAASQVPCTAGVVDGLRVRSPAVDTSTDTDVVPRSSDASAVPTAAPSTGETARRVRQALHRRHFADPSTIEVTVDGTEVILEGWVRSFIERRQASVAAWSSPDVTRVHNRIHLRG